MEKVYVIGIGLIGGSMALDIKRLLPNTSIYGIDTNESHLTEAIELNVIDKKASLKDISNADLVILSIPVDSSLELVDEVLNNISDSTLVIDVGSTKQLFCEKIANHPKRRKFISNASNSRN